MPMSSPADGPLTARLIFVVLCSSFGCWFPCGYSMSIYNTSQWVVVRWVRAVRCSRLEPQGEQPDNSTSNLILWCKNVSEGQEDRLLKENTYLATMWALIGATIPAGAFMAVWTTNVLLVRWGSKKTLLLVNFVGVIGTILTGVCVAANSFEVFIFGRFIIGMNIGLVCSVLPLYIAEISPVNLRGAMGSVPGLTWVVGGLVGAVFGMPDVFGTQTMWPALTLFRFVPAAVLFFALPFCPESPRYLIMSKADATAVKRSLQWLRGTRNVDDELDLIYSEMKDDSNERVMSIGDIFRDNVVRSALFICMAVFWGQQLTGFNAFIFYSTGLFDSAGMTKNQALYGSLGLMTAQILAVVTSMILMDRAGRRTLLLVGNTGCLLTTIFMVPLMIYSKENCSWCHLGSLASVMVFILAFNVGPCTVPWVLISELFPTSAKKSTMMVGSSCCHLGTLTVSFLFPLVQTAIGEWTFAIFATTTALSTVFTYFCVPETKGKSFERIQQDLRLRYR